MEARERWRDVDLANAVFVPHAPQTRSSVLETLAAAARSASPTRPRGDCCPRRSFARGRARRARLASLRGARALALRFGARARHKLLGALRSTWRPEASTAARAACGAVARRARQEVGARPRGARGHQVAARARGRRLAIAAACCNLCASDLASRCRHARLRRARASRLARFGRGQARGAAATLPPPRATPRGRPRRRRIGIGACDGIVEMRAREGPPRTSRRGGDAPAVGPCVEAMRAASRALGADAVDEREPLPSAERAAKTAIATARVFRR